ncbi:hypothetical protein KF707_17355 [Candidatus Obscuribacterales bacterium]|jgi:hypothetical protein|nr:hypothetical protein [Candidatus Obscuribacterales bacterium]MBX3137998.1 hypothetical protein [Candidatus Obscuribacterales bacterium]MBX3152871.1 hypothetical protein [Candidatus Obscuribacterales bacterium]
MNLFKSSLSVLFAAGLVASTAAAASAQSLDVGGIRMGSNGPQGTFSTGLGNLNVSGTNASTTFTTGGLNGRLDVGTNGVYANTSAGSFGFSMPGGGNGGIVSSPSQGGVNYGQGGGYGPQGQAVGGFANGIGSGGSAYSSQGATGDQYHESDTTNTKFQGNSRYTRKNNNSIYERQQTNLLSTFSTDPSSVPSGSFDYGFQTGAGSWLGTARGALRGWYLPRTSTGSFDGNIVSP